MKKILIFALTIILAAKTFGQVSYNQEFQVNTYRDGNQSWPSITYLLEGGYVIAWRSSDDGQYGIYFQIFSESGIMTSEEIKANSNSAAGINWPCVSGLNNGGFVVCWEMDNDGHQSGIFGQIFNNNGQKIGNEFQVNSYFTDDQERPSVTKLSNDGFVVCWTSYGQDGSEDGIYAQIYYENGIKVGNEFLVNTSTDGRQVFPNISELTNDRFIICWTSYHEISLSGIYAQLFENNGNKVGNEFRVNTYYYNAQSDSKVSQLINGGFIICWKSEGQEGYLNKGIYAQIYDENGIKVGSEFHVNTFTNSIQREPTVSALFDGRFVICWVSRGNEGNVNVKGIYAQIFDEYGIKVGNEFKIVTGGDWQSLSSLSNGGFAVAYGKYSNNNDVFGKYYLGEPISHNLISFDLQEPELDATLNIFDPIFRWNQPSNVHVNFPWELTYDLYIDDNADFTNPMKIYGIQDTIYQFDSLGSGQTHFWKVLARNIAGDSLWSSDVFGFYINPIITSIENIELPLIEKFALYQNYPNPFNPTTKIKFTIPAKEKGEKSKVQLKIYDILGNEITTLVNEQKPPGTYEVEFDGKGLTSGIYFYKLSVGNYSETRKMLLMK